MKTKQERNFSMTDIDMAQLEQELKLYEKEKEKIRNLVGSLGGIQQKKYHRLINILFIVSVLFLFIIDLLMTVFDLPFPVPHLFSIQIGLLLVSVKIIWMIHSQTKVNHFQFWILNSLEFYLIDVTKRIKHLERLLEDTTKRP
jgi:hypothetical protein